MGDFENQGQLLVQEVLRYWWFRLMEFHIFSTIYVLKDKESIADIPTELSSLGDLENF